MHFSPWDIVFLSGFISYVWIRGVFAGRCQHNEKVERRVGASEVGLLTLVSIGSLLLPVLHLFTPLLRFADYGLPAAVHGCGVVVMLAALWLFWRSHADLGQNWSVTLEMRQGHELVTRGVYRSVRHPMYAAILLFSVARGLLLDNWLAGWAALATFVPLYLTRAPREEHMMVDFFGEPYRDYMGRTGRLLPRFGVDVAGRESQT